MEKLEIGTIVEFCYGMNNYKYEIIRNDIKSKKVEKLFFGKDDNGNILNTATGNFDYVLAEYNPKGEFVRNITCAENDINKRV